MTLGRCPLIIFCSQGTPPREVPRVFYAPVEVISENFVEPTNPEFINPNQQHFAEAVRAAQAGLSIGEGDLLPF